MALLRRSLRAGWLPSDHVRRVILERLRAIAGTPEGAPNHGRRVKAATARTVVAAEAENIRAVCDALGESHGAFGTFAVEGRTRRGPGRPRKRVEIIEAEL